MNDSKPWWQSTGTIAAIVTFAVSTLKMLGVLDADHAGIVQASLPDLITGIIGQALAIWSFIGRVSARKVITFGGSSVVSPLYDHAFQAFLQTPEGARALANAAVATAPAPVKAPPPVAATAPVAGGTAPAAPAS